MNVFPTMVDVEFDDTSHDDSVLADDDSSDDDTFHDDAVLANSDQEEDEEWLDPRSTFLASELSEKERVNQYVSTISKDRSDSASDPLINVDRYFLSADQEDASESRSTFIACKRKDKKQRELLTEEVRQIVCELFPRLNQSGDQYSRREFQSLVKSVVRYLKTKAFPKTNSLEPSQETRNATREFIKRILYRNYPNRAFFQLLSRWARKKGTRDFSLDAFNTLVIVASNLENSNLSHLLLNSRDFKIKPKRISRRRRIHVSYIASEDDRKVHSEKIIDKIDLSIRLMYSSLHSTHDIYFSQIRMNSVKSKRDINIPSAISLLPDLQEGDANANHQRKTLIDKLPDVHQDGDAGVTLPRKTLINERPDLHELDDEANISTLWKTLITKLPNVNKNGNVGVNLPRKTLIDKQPDIQEPNSKGNYSRRKTLIGKRSCVSKRRASTSVNSLATIAAPKIKLPKTHDDLATLKQKSNQNRHLPFSRSICQFLLLWH